MTNSCLVILALSLVIVGDALHDGYFEYTDAIPEEGFPDDLSSRLLRNIYPGRYPEVKNVRFGWQYPIRYAPTLPPPVNQYPDRDREEGYPGPFRPSYPNEKQNEPQVAEESAQYTQENANTRRPITTTTRRPSGCPLGHLKSKTTGKCLPLGSQESCNENMAFYADPSDTEYGKCDCLQDLNRPLVYHSETDKCYFVFQQAFCSSGEWLILDPKQDEISSPRCRRNLCMEFTSRDRGRPNWNWRNNGIVLDNSGTVALLHERTCSILGSSCSRKGTGRIKDLIQDTRSEASSISLRFEGTNLVCDSQFIDEFASDRNGYKLTCKPGLLNKWKLEGNCK